MGLLSKLFRSFSYGLNYFLGSALDHAERSLCNRWWITVIISYPIPRI